MPKGKVKKVNAVLNRALGAAAKKVKKNIDAHFKTDKWPLDYSFYIQEVFYQAFGYHLETHLLKVLYNNDYALEYCSKHGGVLIKGVKNVKRKNGKSNARIQRRKVTLRF